MRLAIALTLVLATIPAVAAPIPKPATGRLSPTVAQLAAARKAYQEIGGKYQERDEEPEDAFDRHRFFTPEPLTVEVVGRLPDLAFRHELVVRVTADTPPEAVAALARLTNLRNVYLSASLFIRPDEVLPQLRALRAVPNLEQLDCSQGVTCTAGVTEAVLGMPKLLSFVTRDGATDEGLAALARHPTLTHLSASSYAVTDAGLAHLAAMPGLRGLDITRCRRVTPAGLAPFAAAGRLTSLAVAVQTDPELPNVVAGPMLTAVGTITSLEEFELGGYTLFTHTEDDWAHLARLTRLRRLSLPYYLNVSDAFLARLTACPELTDFAARCDEVTDAGARSLAKLARLRTLRLYSPTRLTDAGVGALASLPRLELLDISGSTKVTDAGAAALSRAKSLSNVDLRWTAVTAVGVDALSAGCGPRLTHLKLTEVKLSDAGIARLARACPNLREIEFYKCTGITDASVTALGTLRDLRRLQPGDATITDAGYAELANLLPACDDLWAVLARLPKESRQKSK